jgi:hypothetical protein
MTTFSRSLVRSTCPAAGLIATAAVAAPPVSAGENTRVIGGNTFSGGTPSP